jgi:NAD(P)-dependent dehydrogenase (short-subunit alcohol dehydrogenase family)
MSNRQPLTNVPAVALVTGAGNRIGAALAKALAGAGYAVVIHYRSDEDGANATRDDIIAAGGKAAVIKADLTQRDDRATLVARAAEAFGPLTALINNASLFTPDSAADFNDATWDQHFAIHAQAPIFLARDFAAQLPKGAHGNIVNIIDERVLHPTPDYFTYTLSKSVLWTATRTMAQTFAPDIRVNAIGPGPVIKHSRQTQAEFDAGVAKLPLQTNAGPEAIAQGVLMLLNTPAMTGQMLALDGGEHLQFLDKSKPTPRK